FEAGNHHRLLHARDFFGLLIVKALHLAAQNWRALDRGVDHSWHPSINAKSPATRADVIAIDGRKILADVPVFGSLFVFEFFLFGDRLLPCERRQFTVTKLTVAGGVHYKMILRF